MAAHRLQCGGDRGSVEFRRFPRPSRQLQRRSPSSLSSLRSLGGWLHARGAGTAAQTSELGCPAPVACAASSSEARGEFATTGWCSITALHYPCVLRRTSPPSPALTATTPLSKSPLSVPTQWPLASRLPTAIHRGHLLLIATADADTCPHRLCLCCRHVPTVQSAQAHAPAGRRRWKASQESPLPLLPVVPPAVSPPPVAAAHPAAPAVAGEAAAHVPPLPRSPSHSRRLLHLAVDCRVALPARDGAPGCGCFLAICALPLTALHLGGGHLHCLSAALGPRTPLAPAVTDSWVEVELPRKYPDRECAAYVEACTAALTGYAYRAAASAQADSSFQPALQRLVGGCNLGPRCLSAIARNPLTELAQSRAFDFVDGEEVLGLSRCSPPTCSRASRSCAPSTSPYAVVTEYSQRPWWTPPLASSPPTLRSCRPSFKMRETPRASPAEAAAGGRQGSAGRLGGALWTPSRRWSCKAARMASYGRSQRTARGRKQWRVYEVEEATSSAHTASCLMRCTAYARWT